MISTASAPPTRRSASRASPAASGAACQAGLLMTWGSWSPSAGATRAAIGCTLLRSPGPSRPRTYTGAQRCRVLWPRASRKGASHSARARSQSAAAASAMRHLARLHPDWTARQPTSRALRVCTRLNPLLRLRWGHEPSWDDGDHRNPDMRGKETRLAVVHDVEPSIAAQPGEQALHDPPDPARQEAPVPRAAGRGRDVDVVCGRRRGERRPLEPTVAEQIALEAGRGQSWQSREGARAVIRVGRLQLELEQRAVLVADGEDLDALDQLAAIDAPRPTARRRAERAAVGHHRRG